MYASRPSTVRQYAGFSTAEASNAFYRKNMAAGQKGSASPSTCRPIAATTATIPACWVIRHGGHGDRRHPRHRILFDGLPLDRTSVSMTMNGAVLPILAIYVVTAEEQGVEQSKLTGTIQNDILKELIVRNTLSIRPRPACGSSATSSATSAEHPDVQQHQHLRLSHAGGWGDRRSGAGLHVSGRVGIPCTGIKTGIAVDDFAPRLSFFVDRREHDDGGRPDAGGPHAVDNDVHVIGDSSLAGGHIRWCRNSSRRW